MSDVWITIAVLGVATVVIRAAGPVLLGGRVLPARFMGVIDQVGPAVLAALVVTQTFTGTTGGLVVDARAAGVAGAAIVVARRAPVTVVIAVAVVVTAAVRALS